MFAPLFQLSIAVRQATSQCSGLEQSPICGLPPILWSGIWAGFSLPHLPLRPMVLAGAVELVLENPSWPLSRDWVLTLGWGALVFLLWPISAYGPSFYKGLSLHLVSLSPQPDSLDFFMSCLGFPWESGRCRGSEGLSSNIPECHFRHSLSRKPVCPRASPDSRAGEKNTASWWEDQHVKLQEECRCRGGGSFCVLGCFVLFFSSLLYCGKIHVT